LGGAIVNFLVPLPIWPGAWIRVAGLAPLAVGIWLLAWARAAFRRHKTALMPWTPSAELVTDGPFGFTRNPVYLSFLLMYLSASLFFDSAYILVVLVVVLVLFDRTQIPREERYGEQKFGNEYRAYKARVRRWI